FGVSTLSIGYGRGEFSPGCTSRTNLPKRKKTPTYSLSTRKKPENNQIAIPASTISPIPLPPRLPPGSTVRNLSWLRRRNSSRSGGVGPDGTCPQPPGPFTPTREH